MVRFFLLAADREDTDTHATFAEYARLISVTTICRRSNNREHAVGLSLARVAPLRASATHFSNAGELIEDSRVAVGHRRNARREREVAERVQRQETWRQTDRQTDIACSRIDPTLSRRHTARSGDEKVTGADLLASRCADVRKRFERSFAAPATHVPTSEADGRGSTRRRRPPSAEASTHPERRQSQQQQQQHRRRHERISLPHARTHARTGCVVVKLAEMMRSISNAHRKSVSSGFNCIPLRIRLVGTTTIHKQVGWRRGC